MNKEELISKSIEKLSSKIKAINIDNINISEYNRNYFTKYQDNYSFYMSYYSQLLLKSLKKLDKPVSESTFIDYGGGCGILSYLAKEIGFKTVVYNDIYEISVSDTEIISKNLDIVIDYYVCGGIEELINKINYFGIKPDLICSFDVLEHIYDLEPWFKTVAKINSDFSLLFMTSANSSNPFIKYRLQKLHHKAEYKDFEKDGKWKEIDINTSFLEERKKIITALSPDLKWNDIELLSNKTRGLRKDDIEKVVYDYIGTGEINYEIEHPTNTCDPYTGNWAENLIDLKKLEVLIKHFNLTASFSNSFYGYSSNIIVSIPKYVLNLIIKLLGSNNLFFSPTYTLEIQKSLPKKHQ
jgi:2-polyprenyl-3-methyl-5-hydroxy-6-metoxy-1,4-benzoquinol methylase